MTIELILYGGIALLAFLYIQDRKDIGRQLWVAVILSTIWVLISRLYMFGDSYHILNLNLLPVVAWTLLLVLLKEFYEEMRSRDKFKRITMYYMAGILLITFLGNLAIPLISDYKLLLGLDLAAPWWALLYFLAIGPAYLLLTDHMKIR